MDTREPRQLLARRLRALREQQWPGIRVNQAQLAAALGGDGRRSVSVPLISSWESQTSPKVPPESRIRDIATFFASSRSFNGQTGRLLSTDEMTVQELTARETLLEELIRLRGDALGADPSRSIQPWGGHQIAESLSAGPWRFEDGRPITIVCAQLPPEMLAKMPYSHPLDPDFIAMYRYSDLDALFELHGHLRAANPTSQVEPRLAHQLTSDDYTVHLVSLGGVDWNSATSSLLDRLQLPVRQVANWKEPGGAYFEVEDEGGGKIAHRPWLDETSGSRVLREDVALFARAVNPFNRKRTVTICNGMYGSGTYGAARALTDARFRDRNMEYIRRTFADSEAFCILARVTVEAGMALTPDWTLPETRLFEWSRS